MRFLSTPSARRATSPAPGMSCTQHNFYPRPPRGGRRPSFFDIRGGGNFYPRPPRGGRRPTPPPGAANRLISIHALREEGDLSISLLALWPLLFLSTPSARRATVGPQYQCRCNRLFLSTPSARRATVYPSYQPRVTLNFYPRPPRGGRRDYPVSPAWSKPISIHALREEGD